MENSTRIFFRRILQSSWLGNLEFLLKKNISPLITLKTLNLKKIKKLSCQMGNFCVIWEIPHEPQAIIQAKVFLCIEIIRLSLSM